MTRKHFHLTAALERLPTGQAADGHGHLFAAKEAEPNEFLVSMLVGDGTYNGLFCPTDEIAKGAATMAGNPLNLDHSLAVEDEVGFVRTAQMFGKALKGAVVLNPKTAKFAVASAYIENRLAAGKPPEVSVGFWCDAEEDDEGRLVASNIQFDHLALVSRGACSPADGCGVGLARKEMSHMDNETPAAGAPPAEAEGAPAAPPAPEVPAPAPCGCKGLKAQIEALESDKKALAARLVVYESRELAALTSEAMRLGVPVEDSDGIPCLTKKIALAKSVREAALKDAPTAPRRFTAPDGAAPPTPDDDLRRLTRLAGIE